MLFVVRCLLFVGWLVVAVDCGLGLFVVRCASLFVAGYWSVALCVVRCVMLFAACWL